MREKINLRVLIYGINYAPELTGIGKYSKGLAEWLVKQGHSVRMVTAPPYYPSWRVGEGYSAWLWRSEEINGVFVRRCPLYVPASQSGLKRLIHLGSFALSSIPVMVRQAFWRPDVIISVAPPLMCAPTALAISKICRAKSWLHVQDFEVEAAFNLGMVSETGFFGRLARRFESSVMKRFSKVSTISNKMVERLVEKGVSADKTVLFPNWADVRDIAPMTKDNAIRRELGISATEIALLYAGNIGEKQGLEIILQAAEQVRDPRFKFVIAGDGSARPRLDEQARQMKLSNIQFFPLQPQARFRELLAAADIHLVIQKKEAADLVLPSKVANIMAAGRPMIITADPETELGELVRQAGCALLVVPGSVDGLREAIEVLANDRRRREIMGKAARTYALQHLSDEKIMAEFEAHLLALAGR